MIRLQNRFGERNGKLILMGLMGSRHRPLRGRRIETMLKNKILEAWFGEWANSIVMVKKADGTPRFRIDVRRLNDI